jgi:hypothetical protein
LVTPDGLQHFSASSVWEHTTAARTKVLDHDVLSGLMTTIIALIDTPFAIMMTMCLDIDLVVDIVIMMTIVERNHDHGTMTAIIGPNERKVRFNDTVRRYVC